MNIAFHSCKNCNGFYREDRQPFSLAVTKFARECTCDERKRDIFVNASYDDIFDIWDSWAYGHALCQACEEDPRNVCTEHTCGR